MGIFKKFNRASPKRVSEKVQWRALESVEQLDEIVQLSQNQKVIIFKHSTRCGISRMVINQFESGYDIPEDEIIAFYLDLLRYRPISDVISQQFAVIHQSPQLLLIEKGECIYHASHYEIQAARLKNY